MTGVSTPRIVVIAILVFGALVGCSGSSDESAPLASTNPDGVQTTNPDEPGGRESQLVAVELELVEGSAPFCEAFVDSLALRRLPDALSGLSEDDGLRAQAVGEAIEALEDLAKAPADNADDIDAPIPDGVAASAGDTAAALRFLLDSLVKLDEDDSSIAGSEPSYLERPVVDDVMSALVDLGAEVDKHCVFIES